MSMQIRFFKIQQVQTGIGTMRIQVWLRMSWIDTRLAWNESEFGGVTTTYLMVRAIRHDRDMGAGRAAVQF